MAVTQIATWNVGKPKDFSRMPAVIVSDDGDGHFVAWKFTGPVDVAAHAIAGLMANTLNMDGRMIVFDRVTKQVRREDGNPYVEINGEFVFDSASNPTAIEV